MLIDSQIVISFNTCSSLLTAFSSIFKQKSCFLFTGFEIGLSNCECIELKWQEKTRFILSQQIERPIYLLCIFLSITHGNELSKTPALKTPALLRFYFVYRICCFSRHSSIKLWDHEGRLVEEYVEHTLYAAISSIQYISKSFYYSVQRLIWEVHNMYVDKFWCKRLLT